MSFSTLPEPRIVTVSWRLFALVSLITVSSCNSDLDFADEANEIDPRELALVPHEGDAAVDEEIRNAQTLVTEGRFPVAALERLGWTYVSKARSSFDSGYYTLANACADAIDAENPGAAEALLLRGHVFNNLHRFVEAEEIARELVEQRGLAFDLLLLGDALMEQGKLSEAIEVYQAGADKKPDLQSYARVGWMRWLIGDLPGAIEATERAVGASSPQDLESRAWVLIRLGNFLFLDGKTDKALLAVDTAIRTQAEYPPALLLRGRILMAGGNFSPAVDALQLAADLNPMPDYQWALLEALESAGETGQANELIEKIENTAARVDPRTFSLYLATRNQDVERALNLARRELKDRQDIFTHDALAWALFASGDIEAAGDHMDLALAEYTEDARLFLHAAVIAEAAGKRDEAVEWMEVAKEFQHALLPGELKYLNNLGERIAGTPPGSTHVAEGSTTEKEPTNL